MKNINNAIFNLIWILATVGLIVITISSLYVMLAVGSKNSQLEQIIEQREMEIEYLHNDLVECKRDEVK